VAQVDAVAQRRTFTIQQPGLSGPRLPATLSCTVLRYFKGTALMPSESNIFTPKATLSRSRRVFFRWTSARKNHSAPAIPVPSVCNHRRVFNRRRCTIRGHQAIFPIINASIHAKEIVAKNGRPMATITAPSIRGLSHRPPQGMSAGRVATSHCNCSQRRYRRSEHRHDRQKKVQK
jgi:hypothetical protein